MTWIALAAAAWIAGVIVVWLFVAGATRRPSFVRLDDLSDLARSA